MHQLHAHHQVIVEKLGRVFAVGANAAHMRGQMDDQVRAGIVQQPQLILLFLGRTVDNRG